MDSTRFDDIGRALAGRGSRRGALSVLAGAVFGSVAGLTGPSEAQGKNKKNKKRNCPKKPCPRGRKRNKRTCQCECVRTSCRGGMEFDLDACRCRCPRDLRECRDGCVGKDECCPGDPPCPEDPKGCCHSPGLEVCTIDGCCPEIDGLKACNNFCVDTGIDPNHCGGCDARCGEGELCVDGECESENPCPDGGVHCPGQTEPFCAPAGHSCCGDNDCNALNECCDPNEGLCCVRGRCTQGRCCTGEREVCAGKCCPFGQICCGGECCASRNCLDNVCCAAGACGDVGASTRVCPAEEESCCLTADINPDPNVRNRGYACPASTPLCARGDCCPLDKPYSVGCQRCCPSLARCDSGECVDPVPGRT